MSLRRRWWLRAGVCVLVVASACSPSTSPSPTTDRAGPSGPIASIDAANPTGRPNESATPALDPTARSRILAAEASGALDADTALLYRLYALTGDMRLPEGFRGDWAEDGAALDLAMQRVQDGPAELRQRLLPFVVRPTDATSVWAPEGGASAAIHLASSRSTAALACQGGWIHDQVAADIPVVIWAPCGADAQFGLVRGFMSNLWTPMTTMMGEPIGDANIAGDAFPDCAECGDGKLDIYLTATSNSRPRSTGITDAAAGLCYETPPFVGNPGAQATSAYIVLNAPFMGDPSFLEGTLAHEFFHALEAAHARTGTIINHRFMWFVEASAAWAESEFVPADRPYVYGRWFGDYQRASIALPSTADLDPYRSFIWPYFMRQEGGRAAVAAAWSAMEGKTGILALQRAIDSAVSFRGRFGDFAVRDWNERLPGDPIQPLFSGAVSTFPATQPGNARMRALDTIKLPDYATPQRYDVAREALNVSYAMFEVDRSVGRLTFDFSGIKPVDRRDIEALLKIKGRGWERRTWKADQVNLCLDDPRDDVEKVILAFGNHDLDPSHSFDTTDWTVEANAGCGDLTGTLTVTREYSYEQTEPGLPHSSSSETLTAVINVVMTRDPNGELIDGGSTYAITRQTKSSRENADCTARFDTTSGGTWAFADHPLGPEYDNGISAAVDRTSGLFFGSIVVHYPFNVLVNQCGGGLALDGIHEVYSCPGGAMGLIHERAGPDEITVSCRNDDTSGSGTYVKSRTLTSITGTLTLSDGPP